MLVEDEDEEDTGRYRNESGGEDEAVEDVELSEDEGV
jgi:hypothetical protein